MEKSKLFKEVVRCGYYVMCIEGDEHLSVSVTNDNCPVFSFHAPTRLGNPNRWLGNPNRCVFEHESFFESKLVCKKLDGNLTLLLSSKREKTVILRIPLEIINAVMNEARQYFNLVPEGLISDFKVELSDGNGNIGMSYWINRWGDNPNYGYGGTSFDVKSLSSWMLLENTGGRSPLSEEEKLISGIIKFIKEHVPLIIKNGEKGIAHEKARTSYIPSENDEPVFLFAVKGYSLALTRSGKYLFDRYGPEVWEEQNLKDMKELMAKSFWQYRVVIASKDDPEAMSFIDEFISLENNDNRHQVSSLKEINKIWAIEAYLQDRAVSRSG